MAKVQPCSDSLEIEPGMDHTQTPLGGDAASGAGGGSEHGNGHVGTCQGLCNNCLNPGTTENCFLKRLKDKSLMRLFVRKMITNDSLEDTVNSQALICALMLTIPYSLITNLGFDFWERIEDYSVKCPQWGYQDVRATGLSSFLATVYCSTGGLILSTVFYLLRPQDNEGLEKW